MFAFLAPYKLYLYGALAAAVLCWGWYQHHTGWAGAEKATAAKYEAMIAESQAKVAAEDARRSTASTEAGTDFLTTLQALAPVEAKTHEAVERVRVIYRTAAAGESRGVGTPDRVPDSRCTRPDGVRAELEQAYNRLAAASHPVQG